MADILRHTPEQSRALARWFASAEFAALPVKEQFKIRDRAVKGWDRLTEDEQKAARRS